MKRFLPCLVAALMLSKIICFAPPIPISGRPVPSMVVFDQVMTNFMTTNAIPVESGVVGIMRNGRIVYSRGFGYLDTTNDGAVANIPLPENAMFRVASISKAVVEESARKLADAGYFGPLGLNRPAFLLMTNGISNGGLLSMIPFNGVPGDKTHYGNLGNSNIYPRISIAQLVSQTSGMKSTWAGNRDVSVQLGITNAANNTDYIRLKLSHPLGYTNGQYNYDGINAICLAEMMDRTYGAGYEACLHDLVMSPQIWIPSTEVIHGKTLRPGRDPREPWYRSPYFGDSLYDYVSPIDQLSHAYGGEFEMDGIRGAGDLVGSSQAFLNFAYNYLSLGDSKPGGGPGDGAIVGTFNIGGDSGALFVAVNAQSIENNVLTNKPVDLAFDLIKEKILAGGFSWPGTTSDGFWVNLGAPIATNQFGGYHTPCNGWTNALSRVMDGTRVRLKTGTVAWTGRITKRLRLDAPEGVVTIGQ